MLLHFSGKKSDKFRTSLLLFLFSSAFCWIVGSVKHNYFLNLHLLNIAAVAILAKCLSASWVIMIINSKDSRSRSKNRPQNNAYTIMKKDLQIYFRVPCIGNFYTSVNCFLKVMLAVLIIFSLNEYHFTCYNFAYYV